MRELIIGKNDSDQRMDRFLKKYFSKAPHSFIYKMLRKKRIKLNNKKAKPEEMICEGDKIQLYLADDTIKKFTDQKFTEKMGKFKNYSELNIVYEDQNIILINKPKDILSHSTNDEQENNVVDNMIGYLIDRGDYDPRVEKTFVPAICNRLDRNTSGIIIGAKNYLSLKSINEAIKKGYIKKYYKCMVKGNINEDILLKDYLIKDSDKNKVAIYEEKKEGAKEIYTKVRVLKRSRGYSLLEVDLITGRPHQIRAHLASINHPIVGDTKYGDKKTNDYFREKYGLKTQFLHGYKIEFNGFYSNLKYLNRKQFLAPGDKTIETVEKKYFY